MKKAFITLLLTFSLVLPALSEEAKSAPTASAATSALIVFDASGSMWGQIKGKPKIEIAREVVKDLVENLASETELGLMVYGHRRKGDCEDIELLIPVGKVDKAAFIRTVEEIMPIGMTPITASLTLAAESLRYQENKATVILVSDGLETCDADPCAAAKKLKELGVDFTAHVIAFDLTPEETEQLRCVAEATGGKFFPASDAASLKDALKLAVSAAASKTAPAPEDAREVEMTAPETAVAGSEIEVAWNIEAEKGDYLTIAEAGAKDSENHGYSYTHEKKSASLTTLIEPGKAEIRYLSGLTGKILGRAPLLLTEFSITLTAPEEVVAGSTVSVAWTGPGYERDFITIVPKDTKEGTYEKWKYTKDGNPLEIIATHTPGDGEIRYMTEQGNKVLARQAIRIVAGEISLKAPAEVVAGSSVAIEWTGPDNKGDYLTIVPKDAEDGKYEKYAYTKAGSPAKVTATNTVGDAEIRYMTESGNKVLARAPITITEAVISLKAPPKAVAGSPVAIEWTGPDNKGDYITIVPKSTPDGQYEKYAYTKAGSPATVSATRSPGAAEIRYMNESGNIVLARSGITITAPGITLKAAPQAIAGEPVAITWTGPNNEGDFITIVPKSAEDGSYEDYARTTAGSPAEVKACATPGPGEIRYMNEDDNTVLARIPITVIAPE